MLRVRAPREAGTKVTTREDWLPVKTDASGVPRSLAQYQAGPSRGNTAVAPQPSWRRRVARRVIVPRWPSLTLRISGAGMVTPRACLSWLW